MSYLLTVTMKLTDKEDKSSVFGVESFAWAQANEAEHATFYNEVTVAS